MSTPKPLILSKLAKDLASRHVSSFLTLEDLITLSKVSKTFQDLFNFKELRTLKIAEEVLRFVLAGGDPKRVKNILPSLPKEDFVGDIILKRAYGREETFSKSEQEMILTRIWSNDAPLEAAAWGGGHFLVWDLLNAVRNLWEPELTKFRLKAAQQLQGVREREDYLAPYKALIEAYEEYSRQYQYEERYNEQTNKLLLKIGACQRNLPITGLHEYCNNGTPFNPPPDFNKAPSRSLLLYLDHYLDLGRLGVTKTLYKGRSEVSSYSNVCDSMRIAMEADCAAMKRFCEIRTSQLEKTIKQLSDPTPRSKPKMG